MSRKIQIQEVRAHVRRVFGPDAHVEEYSAKVFGKPRLIVYVDTLERGIVTYEDRSRQSTREMALALLSALPDNVLDFRANRSHG